MLKHTQSRRWRDPDLEVIVPAVVALWHGFTGGSGAALVAMVFHGTSGFGDDDMA